MGTIIKAECIGCGFESVLYTGGGRSDCNIETIMSALNEENQQALSEALSLGAARISIDRKPCSCSSCRNVYAVPVVTYIIDGEEQSISGVCPSCGNKKHKELCSCPECGADLSIAETGLWD